MSGLGARVVEVLCRSREGDGRGDGSRQELLICFGLHLAGGVLPSPEAVCGMSASAFLVF